jgi:S-formylglutathione hydrolase FrmB
LILVMPAGHEGILHGDTEWANTPSGRWEDFVLDVVHDVDSRFATLADRQHRGIAGDSEGAYGAVNITLHHPGLFSVMESWSGYFMQQRAGPFINATAAELRANSPALYLPSIATQLRRLPLRAWLYQGSADSTPGLRAFGGQLAGTGADVHVAFFPGGHDWALWRSQLPRMLTAAGRWFGERPRSAARLQSSGHSLPPSAIRRLKARRRHYCITHPHACRLFHHNHPGLAAPRS